MSGKIRYGLTALLALVMLLGVIGTVAAQGGRRPLQGRRGLHGEITAINGGTLTIAVRDHSLQVVTNNETTFRVIGQETASLDDFSIGDQVLARGPRQDEGTMTAVFLLRQPEGQPVLGRILEIGPDSLVLRGRQDQEVTIHVSPDTIVAMRNQELTWDGDPAGNDALHDGMPIVAFGEAGEEEHNLTAHTLITTRPQRPQRRGLAGRIASIEGDSFTLATLRGDEVTVLTTEETRFRQPGVEEAGLDDFAPGDEVLVMGQPAADDQFTARIVAAVPENRPHGRPLIGEITGIDGDEISLQARNGRTLTITTNEETIYRIGRSTEASLDDFAGGDMVAIFGELGQEEGTLLATHMMKRR